MDTFIEILLKKKTTGWDFLAMAGIAVLAGVLTFIMIFILLPMFSVFASIIFLLFVGVIYGAYKWITSFKVEYEYILVNGEMDVDKIVDKKSRNRLTTVKLREMEAFGVYKNSTAVQKYMNNREVKKVFACTYKNDEGVYYAVYFEKTDKKLLLFNPNEKMLNVIKKVNPLKVQEFEI